MDPPGKEFSSRPDLPADKYRVVEQGCPMSQPARFLGRPVLRHKGRRPAYFLAEHGDLILVVLVLVLQTLELPADRIDLRNLVYHGKDHDQVLGRAFAGIDRRAGDDCPSACAETLFHGDPVAVPQDCQSTALGYDAVLDHIFHILAEDL